MKKLLFALITLALAATSHAQNTFTYVGKIAPSGAASAIAVDSTGHIILASGTNTPTFSGTVAISGTVPISTGTAALTLSGTTINSGTNTTLTGTVAAGAQYIQFTFNSGTTTIFGQDYAGGTQFYPAVVGRTYPAVVYLITGTGSTISIQTAR